MDIAKCLGVVEELWEGDVSGPGHGMVELAVSGGDRSETGLTADDVYALEGALTEQMTTRHGEPHRWGTVTFQERMSRGEEIPETWARLAVQAVELRAWENPAGRWLVITVADADAEAEVRLLAAATDAAPL